MRTTDATASSPAARRWSATAVSAGARSTGTGRTPSARCSPRSTPASDWLEVDLDPHRRRLAGRAPQPGPAGRPVPRRHHPGRGRGRRGSSASTSCWTPLPARRPGRPRRQDGPGGRHRRPRPAAPPPCWRRCSSGRWPAAAAGHVVRPGRAAGPARAGAGTGVRPDLLDRLPAPARGRDGGRARAGRRRGAPRVVRPEPGRARAGAPPGPGTASRPRTTPGWRCWPGARTRTAPGSWRQPAWTRWCLNDVPSAVPAVRAGW